VEKYEKKKRERECYVRGKRRRITHDTMPKYQRTMMTGKGGKSTVSNVNKLRMLLSPTAKITLIRKVHRAFA
jgi:hypothetical protein